MEDVEKSTWNYKRILIAVLLLTLVIGGGYYLKTYIMMYKNSLKNKSSTFSSHSLDSRDKSQGFEKVLDKEIKSTQKPQESVRGIASQENINLQEAFRGRIESIKKDVENINVVEIASSSPQVQKILNDIKSLEQYPKNQFQEICRKVCGL